MHKKKKVWISVVAIVIAVVILYLILKSPAQTGTNIQTGNNNANGGNSASNQNAPPSASTPKTPLTLYYNLNWQKDYIDKPDSLVSISISGSYNTINISSQTEVSQVILTGTNNKVTFCNSTYTAPTIDTVGINNVVSYVIC